MNPEADLQELRHRQPQYLSAEEIALSFREDDLARLYLKEISNLEVLCEAEEQKLVGQIARGDQAARERLLEHNLLRVAAITREYIHRGLDSLDLLQDGNLALDAAISSYDPNSIYPFAAYVSWQIRRTLSAVLRNCTCLTRIPQEPIIIPQPLDQDMIRNPAMLRRLLEKHNGGALSEQDWMILAARFCPCGHLPLSDAQLGAMMDLTPEEIQEAEYRAVRGRSIRKSQMLRDFLA